MCPVRYLYVRSGHFRPRTLTCRIVQAPQLNAQGTSGTRSSVSSHTEMAPQEACFQRFQSSSMLNLGTTVGTAPLSLPGLEV
jgi:hypothetical protein